VKEFKQGPQETIVWHKDIGKTEVIKNEINPDWETCILVDYFFEKVQIFKFKVSNTDGITNQQLIGKV